jgi:predicted N-acetyltransferase YhbS
MDFFIRKEQPEDYKAVYKIVKDAFSTVSYSDGTEQDYLEELRNKDYFIPELSLVAVCNGKIVGQIVLYEFTLTDSNGKEHIFLNLSPLSVHVDYFFKGIGSRLIKTACEKAAGMGYKAVFLCGEAAYYSRFGFIPTYKYGIFHTDDTTQNADWCMAKELAEGSLKGINAKISIL